MIGPENHSRQMGDHETDKADEARKRYDDADHQGDHQKADFFNPIHFDAQLRGGFLAGRDQVEGARIPVEDRQGRQKRRSDEGKMGVPSLGQIAVEPEEHGVEPFIGGGGNEEHDDGGEKGVDDDAHEQNRGGFHPHLPGAELHQQPDRQQRPGEGHDRHPHAEAEAQDNGHDRPECGSAGHSQDIGVGQGIAQKGLENDAPQRKGEPHEPGQNNPGQADPEQNQAGGVVRGPGPPKQVQNGFQRDIRGSDDHRQARDPHQQKPHQRRQP